MQVLSILHLVRSHNLLIAATAALIGAFLLGSFVQISALFWSPSPELRIFITVGILGSFTTFSALALDFYIFWGRGDI